MNLRLSAWVLSTVEKKKKERRHDHDLLEAKYYPDSF